MAERGQTSLLTHQSLSLYPGLINGPPFPTDYSVGQANDFK